MLTKKYPMHFFNIKYFMSLAFSLFMVCTAFSQNTATALKEVDQMPQFPGCNEANTEDQKTCSNKKFLTFIYENLKYPKEDADKGVEGMVLLNFVVTKEGKIKDIKTKKSLSKACDTESIRVVELMNEKGIRWIPGKKDDKIVDVVFTLPLKFKLQ